MSLFDRLPKITAETNSDQMGQAVEEMVNQAITRRRSHERRWYDNNFFDDGYHFRIVSKKTGRVIDTVNKTTGYVERAIPRASRQIRGVSNLLFAAEPYPVIYPERIIKEQYPQIPDPKTGEMIPGPEYEKAMEEAKRVARMRGIWLSTEWEDEQELPVKLIDAILKAAKNSVSWIQVTSDTKKQKIITSVYDAFEVVCYGDVDDEQHLPFMSKTAPMDIKEVKSSSLFKEDKVAKLNPDNKYATSEIKDAYMRGRYGAKSQDDSQETIIIKETFIKEFLSGSNWEQAVQLGSETGAMEGKSRGDMIMRHIFSAGGVTLNDEYIDYDEYPLVPIRFEPGPLYQVPYIERFIPQNKSVDVIVTRLEKWVNSMVVGVYQQRKGENMQISNIPGGQLVQYETTPLTQMNQASVGNTPFEVINLLNNYIEEQGASTAALNQLPNGVKSGVAIESVKATEYANLKIPTMMLKQSIKRISERMIERADKDFLEPVEVSSIQDGEPEYFDIIGQRGMELSQRVNKKLPGGIIPITKKVKVRIEIEPGLGLTMEGKRQSMQQIIEFMLKLSETGYLNPEAMKQIIKKFLETYGYGSTEEFMEAIDNGITDGQMTENQIQQLKIAIAETLKDLDAVGPKADEKLVMASKLGTLESLQDAGLVDKMGGPDGMDPMEARQKIIDDMVKIYKDSPPDIRRQIEQNLGMQPSDTETISPVQADTASKIHGMTTTDKQTQIAQSDHLHKASSTEQELKIKEMAAKQKTNHVASK